MADQAFVTSNIISGNSSTGNVTNGVTVVSNLVESTNVTSTITVGAKGDPGAPGAKGDPGTTDYNLLTNKPFIQKITVATSAPSSPSLNDLWVNSS